MEIGFWCFSSSLHRRHDCDLVPRFDLVVAIDEFNASADQNSFIMDAQGRNLRIKLLKQICDRRVAGKIDIERLASRQIAQLGIELDADLHRI